MKLTDTHAHLDDERLWDDLDAAIGRAQDAGVDRILAVGSNLASSRRAVDAAHRYSIVYAAVGVHPHDARSFGEESEEVEALLDAEKVVAVGEIGLDHYRLLSPVAAQMHAFTTQLGWAKERGLPVSVHNRDADEPVLDALRDSGVPAVMHAFSSTAHTANRALEIGCSISFAGNLTYRRSDELRALAASLPADRLLIETDSPVLAPQPRRGRTNEPAYVSFVAECLAEVRGVAVEDLCAQTAANASRVFGWGPA